MTRIRPNWFSSSMALVVGSTASTSWNKGSAFFCGPGDHVGNAVHFVAAVVLLALYFPRGSDRAEAFDYVLSVSC